MEVSKGVIQDLQGQDHTAGTKAQAFKHTTAPEEITTRSTSHNLDKLFCFFSLDIHL